VESEFRDTRLPNRFPCFSNRLLSIKLPHKFKPSNHTKYNGGDDDVKALFFPMALEAIPLQWFNKLRPGSIKSWEDLQRAFCENFAGIISHPITHTELKTPKQKPGESLRDYYRRFRELCA
jgi:hypothetical protein